MDADSPLTPPLIISFVEPTRKLAPDWPSTTPSAGYKAYVALPLPGTIDLSMPLIVFDTEEERAKSGK